MLTRFCLAECRESKQCAPAKHHFDECVERVTNASEEHGAKEDCVEECESTISSSAIRSPAESRDEDPICHGVASTTSAELRTSY